jgi:hypothetical protein
MIPDYIKEILGNPMNIPIVLTGDGQNKAVKKRRESQPINDIVVADIFISTRLSTIAVIIAQTRVVLGADLKSNFVYVSRKRVPRDDRGTARVLQVCEERIFLCNVTKSDLFVVLSLCMPERSNK